MTSFNCITSHHKVIIYIESDREVAGDESAPIEQSWSDCKGGGSRQYNHIPVLKCGCIGMTIQPPVHSDQLCSIGAVSSHATSLSLSICNLLLYASNSLHSLLLWRLNSTNIFIQPISSLYSISVHSLNSTNLQGHLQYLVCQYTGFIIPVVQPIFYQLYNAQPIFYQLYNVQPIFYHLYRIYANMVHQLYSTYFTSCTAYILPVVKPPF